MALNCFNMKSRLQRQQRILSAHDFSVLPHVAALFSADIPALWTLGRPWTWPGSASLTCGPLQMFLRSFSFWVDRDIVMTSFLKTWKPGESGKMQQLTHSILISHIWPLWCWGLLPLFPLCWVFLSEMGAVSYRTLFPHLLIWSCDFCLSFCLCDGLYLLICEYC